MGDYKQLKKVLRKKNFLIPLYLFNQRKSQNGAQAGRRHNRVQIPGARCPVIFREKYNEV